MKKSKFLGVLALVLGCFAVVFLMDTPLFLKYRNGEIKDYNSVQFGELKKGDLVQGTIDDTDGQVAEMEETNTMFGIPTSKRTTSRYYALYTYDDIYVLYETAKESELKQLDKIAEESTAYYTALQEAYEQDGEDADYSAIEPPTATLEFTGEVKEMPDDLKEIFRQWYGDGFDEDCETDIIISYSNYDRFSWVIYAGAGCAVLAIVMLVLAIAALRKEQRDQQFSY